MNPFYYNIIITILGFVYVFFVVGIMDYLVKKKNFPQDISRKIVHIAAGSWLIIWLFYDSSSWSKYLNIAPAFLWTILLLVKGFTAKPDDEAVKTMTRTGDRKELLRGPLYFTIVMSLMGTIFYRTPLALTTMGILGWGDGLAPIFGQRFGKHKYKVLSEKSLEGSISFFLFGLIASIIFNILFFNEVNYSNVILITFIATMVEGLSPKDLDNILIPFSVIVMYLFIF